MARVIRVHLHLGLVLVGAARLVVAHLAVAAVALAAAVPRGDGDMTLNAKLDEIAQHIKTAEAKTTGEIVCLVAKKSDAYRYIPILWAALVSLAVPLVFIIVRLFTDDVSNSYAVDIDSVESVYFVQLTVFLLAFLLGQWSGIKYKLIPKSVKLQRAKRLAAEVFMHQEIHLTDERTGVLLFISLAERYVEVIADHGIYSVLDDKVWQEIVDKLIVQIKADDMAAGIMVAVDEIGALLQTHFPAEGKDKNELADHLILLD